MFRDFPIDSYIEKANNGIKIFPEEDWPTSLEELEKLIMKKGFLRINYFLLMYLSF